MRRLSMILPAILTSLGVAWILPSPGNSARAAGQTPATKQVVSLPGSKVSGLPISSGIKVGNMMFLSGVIGTDPKTNELVSEDVGAQTRTCLEKLRAVLRQGGMDLIDAANCTVYLTDLGDYDAMNEAYADYFPADPPTRACVQVAKLVRGAKVEISMIAIRAR